MVRALWLWLALAAMGSTVAPASPPQKDPPPRIAGFQARLFNSRTGALSADVLAGQVELGNVPAGELASVSTLVVVDVDFGEGLPVPQKARVRLVATEVGRRGPNRQLLDSTERPGPVAKDGTTHIAFWLPNTGCKTVTLRATLLGASQRSTKTQTIPFACYE